MIDKANMEKEYVSDEILSNLAIYLEGIAQVKGNLQPLGLDTLKHLWGAVHYLRGDVRYEAKRDRTN